MNASVVGRWSGNCRTPRLVTLTTARLGVLISRVGFHCSRAPLVICPLLFSFNFYCYIGFVDTSAKQNIVRNTARRFGVVENIDQFLRLTV